MDGHGPSHLDWIARHGENKASFSSKVVMILGASTDHEFGLQETVAFNKLSAKAPLPSAVPLGHSAQLG
jgi:hypothetical protein